MQGFAEWRHMRKAMTGKEAWALISPMISPMSNGAMNNSVIGEAYVTVFIALKEFDERGENGRNNNNGRGETALGSTDTPC